MSFITKAAIAACALVAGVAAMPAMATPLSSGSIYTANGGALTAYFIGFSAGDTDTVAVGVGGLPFFTNKLTPIGTSASLGSPAATTEVLFSLFDVGPPANTWSSGPGSRNTDSAVHARLSIDAANFATDFSGLPLASRNYVSNNAAGLLAGATFIGFEDRPRGTSDFDYNDLVFAVVAGRPASTPEPVSMAILGTGLLGLGLARRRRAS